MNNDIHIKQGVIIDEKGETPYTHKCEHYLDKDDTPVCLCGRTMEESASVSEGYDHGLKFRWWCSGIECEEKRRKTQSRIRTVCDLDMQLAGVPEILRDATIDNFKPRQNTVTHKTADFKNSAKKYAKDPRGVVLFSGKVGTGKTHLAVGILREVMVNGTSPVHFKRSAELLLELQDTFQRSDETVGEIIWKYEYYKFLVLDDLGTEKPTEYAVMILGEIINSRYSNNKPTIITSNLTLGKIQDNMDARIASRISTPEWKFCFSDYRRKVE